jgi:hypothetical protein
MGTASLSWSQATKVDANQSSKSGREIIFIKSIILETNLENKLSEGTHKEPLPSRTKRGTVVPACAISVVAAGKHQDPSLRSG